MSHITPTHIPEGDYYTLKQLAKLKGKKHSTTRMWMRVGWLTGIQIGNGWLIPAKVAEAFEPPPVGRPPVDEDADLSEHY